MGTAEPCRKHKTSDATFHEWRGRYDGVRKPGAKRLKALEEENAKLKTLLAESVPDAPTPRELLAKNFRRPVQGGEP